MYINGCEQFVCGQALKRDEGGAHHVGVRRALRGLKATYVQHEASIQQHQPPLVVAEYGNQNVA